MIESLQKLTSAFKLSAIGWQFGILADDFWKKYQYIKIGPNDWLFVSPLNTIKSQIYPQSAWLADCLKMNFQLCIEVEPCRYHMKTYRAMNHVDLVLW